MDLVWILNLKPFLFFIFLIINLSKTNGEGFMAFFFFLFFLFLFWDSRVVLVGVRRWAWTRLGLGRVRKRIILISLCYWFEIYCDFLSFVNSYCWFHKLFMSFSCYTYVNILKKIQWIGDFKVADLSKLWSIYELLPMLHDDYLSR